MRYLALTVPATSAHDHETVTSPTRKSSGSPGRSIYDADESPELFRAVLFLRGWRLGQRVLWPPAGRRLGAGAAGAPGRRPLRQGHGPLGADRRPAADLTPPGGAAARPLRAHLRAPGPRPAPRGDDRLTAPRPRIQTDARRREHMEPSEEPRWGTVARRCRRVGRAAQHRPPLGQRRASSRPAGSGGSGRST